MEYLDFEVEVEAGGEGDYDVSVVRSPAGEAQAKMRFPYDRLALQNRLQALQIALLRSGGSRRSATAEDRAVEELGRGLFEALFAGEIASRLHVSRTIARREGRGVRIKLRISAPELLGLPWEYLYDANSGDYLALAVSTPVVRYMPIAQPIQPLEVSPPLRVLAMIAGPRDMGELDAQRERQRLELALERLQERRLVDLEWVAGETWEDLQQALWRGPWHVFHFIGHGGFNERRGTGVVYLAGPDGNARELSATDLARLLGDHDPLRLAVLNSCETAQGTQTDIFSSTAAALVRRGTPAVVAMQFEITDDAAIQFSRSFYAAVAHGMPVDAAVAEARKAIALQVSNTYEWGTPVLFMRSPDGLLFNVPAVAPPPQPEPAPPPQPATRPPPTPAAQPAAGHPMPAPAQPARRAGPAWVATPAPAIQRRSSMVALVVGLGVIGALVLIALLVEGLRPPPALASLSLAPQGGAAGATLTVSGFGFGAGEEVIVSWAGGSTTQRTQADGAGWFSAQASVPDDGMSGEREVVARGLSSGMQARSFFFVIDARTGRPDANETGGPADPLVAAAVCAVLNQEFSRAGNYVDLMFAVQRLDVAAAEEHYALMQVDVGVMKQALATVAGWPPLAGVAADYSQALDAHLAAIDGYLGFPGPDTLRLLSDAEFRLARLYGELLRASSADRELGVGCL